MRGDPGPEQPYTRDSRLALALALTRASALALPSRTRAPHPYPRSSPFRYPGLTQTSRFRANTELVVPSGMGNIGDEGDEEEEGGEGEDGGRGEGEQCGKCGMAAYTHAWYDQWVGACFEGRCEACYVVESYAKVLPSARYANATNVVAAVVDG